MDIQSLVEKLSTVPFKGTISQPVNKKADVKKISMKALKIKGKDFIQLTKHYAVKDIHENYSIDVLLCHLEKLFQEYRQGIFDTEEGNYHVLVSSSGKVKVLSKKLEKRGLDLAHNRSKNTVLREGESIDFLVHLGVMTREGKVIASKSHKFKQINRFLEIIEDVIRSMKKREKIYIVDFGCGKSYLTFALYYYLADILGMDAKITGLDLKADVIKHCSGVAEKLGYGGLKFEVGKIEGYVPQHSIDMVVALHACDTATDAAIAQAVRWGAEAILAVPCCQHELYGQVKNEELQSLLKHGILKERFAALATDAARANLLEMQGYRTQVMEFIDLEHTPKNLLIKAIKTGHISPKAKEEYQRLKSLLHFNITLEKLLSEG